MKRRRTRDLARVRVHEEQTPLFHVLGEHGGWYVSLLWHFGHGLDVSWREMRRLLTGSRGEILVARRLDKRDLRTFDFFRTNVDRETVAYLIPRESTRWRSPRKR